MFTKYQTKSPFPVFPVMILRTTIFSVLPNKHQPPGNLGGFSLCLARDPRTGFSFCRRERLFAGCRDAHLLPFWRLFRVCGYVYSRPKNAAKIALYEANETQKFYILCKPAAIPARGRRKSSQKLSNFSNTFYGVHSGKTESKTQKL